ncbi:MAG TPA: A24 family peptidase [Acidimicrobiales bacterium]|jgi:prepilin signal peptidase PulO-like enzyme (type II secretory pathway)|nr:A24 family peptidase [Acidimicrobiales bacterium]
MTAQLIAGASVTGLVAGGLLDPVGQRLAERSAHEQRRRDEAAGLSAARAASSAGDQAQPTRLLPVGVSPVRTAGAAVVTGVLAAGGASRFGAHFVLVPFIVFFSVLVVVSTTDLSHGLIPRRLVYPGLAVISGLLVVAAAVDGQWHRLATAGIGAVAAFAVLFLIWWLAPRGIGFGDVRLAALIGLATGWIGLLDVYVALVAAFIAGLLGGVATIVMGGTGGQTRIPFAPALAAGAIVAVFWGAPIALAVFHRPI